MPWRGVAARAKFLNAGLAFQKKADATTSPEEATALLQKAAEQYRQAAIQKPDLYRAHALWAHCLHLLVRRTADPAQRQALAQTAREQFAKAAGCEGADWQLYDEWGALLDYYANHLPSGSAERRAARVAAKDAFENSLKLAPYKADHARVEHDLGFTLVTLGLESHDLTEQRALFQRAIARFDSATRVPTVADTARVYGMWGVALLQLGKLNNDHMLIRQAIERLQTALERNPHDPETNYNLACTYALLDHASDSLRYLRACLDNDPHRTFYNNAATDPDLDALRRTPEYNQIFPNADANVPGSIDRPSLSNH
jgi:tetratricopeptide (TPR) repeat protein